MRFVVVDAANVIGSRPDGWWRDRAGAARRLYQRLSAAAGRGLVCRDSAVGDGAVQGGAGILLVLEGAARRAELPEAVVLPETVPAAAALADAGVLAPGTVRVLLAPGSGDDAIAAAAGQLAGTGGCLVVTADRELRRRCEARGAVVAGPGWLLGQLDQLEGPGRLRDGGQPGR